MVAIVTATDFGGVYGLVPVLFLFSSMNGFILANSVAGALSAVSTRLGTASALLGAIQYGSGMIGATLVGLLANGTPFPQGCVLAFAGAGSLVFAILAARWSRLRGIPPGRTFG
jgi:DHA1 family bicyclomycin/chloramphenicol resistance-like MFS transporter